MKKATAKQADFLKSMMLRNPSYVQSGILTGQAQRAFESIILDAAKTSQSIKMMLDAGFGRSKTSRPKSAKQAFRSSRGFTCGGVRFSSRWDHEQNCNNPNCGH